MERVRRKPIGYEPLLPAQLCAHMLLASPDGIEALKLSKLAYMAEREYLKTYGLPLLYDDLLVGANGPYCRETSNGILGRRDKETWERHVERRGGRIHARAGTTHVGLDHLSLAASTIADALVEHFASLSGEELVEWMRTPEHVPEWAATLMRAPPRRRPRRIPITVLGQAIGIDPATLGATIAEARSIKRALSS